MIDFFNYISQLIKNGFNMPFTFWISLLFIFSSLFFISIRIKNRKNSDYLSLRYYVYSRFFMILIALYVIFLIAILWIYVYDYQYFFAENDFSLDIIVFVLLFSFLIVSLTIHLKINYKSNPLSFILKPISIKEKNIRLISLKRRFSKTKLLVIFLIIPFSILLLEFLQINKASVSIVIDNSGSTNSFIDYGRNGLSQAISSVYPNTLFNISFFKSIDDYSTSLSDEYKLSVDKIINESDYTSLNCENLNFMNTNSAKAFISDFALPEETGSPIIETMWANFLLTIENCANSPNMIKILIVMTDGKDLLYSEKEDISDFNILEVNQNSISQNIKEYFDKIIFINIGGDKDEYLFENIDNSLIYNGNDKQSYSKALTHALININNKNWNFILLLSGLIVLSILSILFIKI